MAEQMPSTLLNEWIAYYRVEPFGEERADVRAALVASTIANANRGKDQKALTIEDYLLRWEPKQEQSVDEMIQFAAMFTAAMGGQDKRGANGNTAEVVAGAGDR